MKWEVKVRTVNDDPESKVGIAVAELHDVLVKKKGKTEVRRDVITFQYRESYDRKAGLPDGFPGRAKKAYEVDCQLREQWLAKEEARNKEVGALADSLSEGFT